MSRSTARNEGVTQHYTRPDLGNVILSALAAAGKDIDNLTPEDLAPVDEFHVRGREATLELAGAVRLDASKHVLDVGSGLGGASRCLARAFGCRVTGVDITGEYCRVATMLAARLGLSRGVRYLQGDALDLAFSDGTFDVVWTQHAAMNIADKATLYREMSRVLKPGGAVAIYDILAGPAGPVLFPVPWARSPETSFLVTPEELRRLLHARGLTITTWKDTTAAARTWFTNLVQKLRATPGTPPLGPHLLMGQDFRVMAHNQRRNVDEGRIVLAQVVATKR